MRKLFITSSLITLSILYIPIPQSSGSHPSSINQVIIPIDFASTISQLKLSTQKLKVGKGTVKAKKTVKTALERPKAGFSSCPQLRTKLSNLGVPSNQLDSAIRLSQRESGCKDSARNPSGACGAFQSLPCGKWGAPGTEQYLKGAIKYSNDIYRGFNGALRHSLANDWY